MLLGHACTSPCVVAPIAPLFVDLQRARGCACMCMRLGWLSLQYVRSLRSRPGLPRAAHVRSVEGPVFVWVFYLVLQMHVHVHGMLRSAACMHIRGCLSLQCMRSHRSRPGLPRAAHVRSVEEHAFVCFFLGLHMHVHVHGVRMSAAYMHI